MPDVDAILRNPARFFYEAASEDEQDELDRIIVNICRDPRVDEEVKFVLPAPPAVLNIYSDKRFWVVYHQLNNWTISILNIGYAHEAQTPNRPEAHE